MSEQVGDPHQNAQHTLIPPGLYGLIAAKTYLHISGTYDQERDLLDVTDAADAIPDCFNKPRNTAKGDAGGVLVLDSASDIGGHLGRRKALSESSESEFIRII